MEIFDGDGKIAEKTRAIVLPDDQQHCPAAQEVFGKDSEVGRRFLVLFHFRLCMVRQY